MNRAAYLAILLATALAAFALVLLWYLSSYQSGNGSISGAMGQMMGGQYAAGMTNPMPGYVWGVLAAFLVVIVAAVAGLAYYLAVPPIKTVAAQGQAPTLQPASTDRPKESWEVLLRTSKPDEKKVLEVLAAHNGKYLQKFIVKETGLSRLKAHRIISRLVERGVVTAVQSGNTNEISLAAWLDQSGTTP